MQTDKAGKLIRKIQALYENLSDQGTMSSLERDLILSYLRELYEEISVNTVTVSGAPVRHAPETHRPVTRAPEEIKASPPPRPKEVLAPPVEWREESSPVKENVPPLQAKPVDVPTVREMPTPEVEPIEPERVQHAVPEVHPEPTYAPVHFSGNGSVDDEVLNLFEFRQIGELSEKLQLQPLDRMEQGMGINERILMINELFKGDGILFNKTLKDLDGMRSFEEARRYLITGVANQFQWGEKSRKAQAALFVQLVRRRFLLV